jgi:hypothetical protein
MAQLILSTAYMLIYGKTDGRRKSAFPQLDVVRKIFHS